jgi:hypothetical protein
MRLFAFLLTGVDRDHASRAGYDVEFHGVASGFGSDRFDLIRIFIRTVSTVNEYRDATGLGLTDLQIKCIPHPHRGGAIELDESALLRACGGSVAV